MTNTSCVLKSKKFELQKGQFPQLDASKHTAPKKSAQQGNISERTDL